MSDDLDSQVWEALKRIRFPGMSRDIVSFGFVTEVKVEAGRARVGLRMSTHNPAAGEKVRQEVENAVGAVAGVKAVEVQLEVVRPAGPPESAAKSAVARDATLVPEVRYIVAVASGKGGVGKSTVAANLAISLGELAVRQSYAQAAGIGLADTPGPLQIDAIARGEAPGNAAAARAAFGHRVGLLDSDIYGPSVPMMFGIRDRPFIEANRIRPFEKYGIRLMSLGFVLETDTPVIWRGPMVTRAIEQMLGDVEWGALDYLILDLPPGTGDAQLTITQKVPLSGAVIVTTPQDVALIDARKGLAMFRKVNVPVVGIVENMSFFVCPYCSGVTDVFKRGGGRRTAELLETAFLGAIPLDPKIVVGGDAGVPIVVAEPDGAHAAAFRQIAETVAGEVARQAAEKPRLSIV